MFLKLKFMLETIWKIHSSETESCVRGHGWKSGKKPIGETQSFYP